MKNAPIKLIELDDDGHLKIFPDVSVSGDFQFIYRDASGVTWNNTSQALVANEPDRWVASKLFGQIICAAISEYGIKLEIRSSTSWINISDVLKAELIESANSAYVIRGVSN